MISATRNPLRRRSTLLGALLFALALVLATSGDSLLAALQLHPGARAAHYLGSASATLAWLLGAFVFHRIAAWLLWDVACARVLKIATPGALRALGAIGLLLVTTMCIVSLVFGRSVTGFLAALGAGSFALGFALRSLFADIFTGLAVNLDRTFRIGDWIEITDRAGNTVGQIEEIGWRSTHLRTDDQKTVVIPNSYLGIHRITNISRPTPATRFQVTVVLDFSVPVARAKRILLAALHAVHEVRGFIASREPEVLASEATESGLQYTLRYWIEPWTGISPSRAHDLVMTSTLEHLRTAGIVPACEKTEIYHRDLPLRNAEGHTREEQLTLLARLEIFAMLDRDQLEALADCALRRVFAAGDIVFAQGEKGDSLVILTEGLFDVSISAGDHGEPRRVGRVLPGEYVGEMSLLTGEPRSATVRAVTPCVAYEIAGEALRPLVAERPDVAGRLSEVVARRRLRNAEIAQHRAGGDDEEVASFARQVLVRMLSFLSPGRS